MYEDKFLVNSNNLLLLFEHVFNTYIIVILK